MDGVRFGDLLDLPERVEDRVAVGVDAPRPVLGGGIAPGDREDLVALAHEILDHAAARRDIHDVVLVDHRRHQQQRDGVYLLRLRGVLDQFEYLTAVDDFPGVAATVSPTVNASGSTVEGTAAPRPCR